MSINSLAQDNDRTTAPALPVRTDTMEGTTCWLPSLNSSNIPKCQLITGRKEESSYQEWIHRTADHNHC